jgi:hypothetical protein
MVISTLTLRGAHILAMMTSTYYLRAFMVYNKLDLLA